MLLFCHLPPNFFLLHSAWKLHFTLLCTLRSTPYCTLRSVLDNTFLSSAPKLLPPLCSETVLCSALYSVLSVILYSLLREVCYSTLCSVPKLLPASLCSQQALCYVCITLHCTLYSAQYVDKKQTTDCICSAPWKRSKTECVHLCVGCCFCLTDCPPTLFSAHCTL